MNGNLRSNFQLIQVLQLRLITEQVITNRKIFWSRMKMTMASSMLRLGTSSMKKMDIIINKMRAQKTLSLKHHTSIFVENFINSRLHHPGLNLQASHSSFRTVKKVSSFLMQSSTAGSIALPLCISANKRWLAIKILHIQ